MVVNMSSWLLIFFLNAFSKTLKLYAAKATANEKLFGAYFSNSQSTYAVCSKSTPEMYSHSKQHMGEYFSQPGDYPSKNSTLAHSHSSNSGCAAAGLTKE